MSRVLLIEDDEPVRRAVTLGLRRQGHEVRAAASGEEGLAAFAAAVPDVVVLDWMLPGVDGLEVCRRLRTPERAHVPLLLVTARGDDIDVVVGLEAGADDYVVKPVRARVLDARIRAVLRRLDTPGTPPPETHGPLTIDRTGLRVAHEGAPVPLAPSELRLLLTLSASPGQVLSRQQLLEAVWEHSYHGDIRLVDACVKRLRNKLAAAADRVETVRGFGYRFRGGSTG
ncbi:response regulator transcription factor [Streptomyces sp. NPDC001054]